MKYAAIFLPDFSLQALRRDEPRLAGRPVALATGEGRKACLAQISKETSGVEVGLTVTLALARCPGLEIRERSLGVEKEAERLLLAAAFTLSPRVEMTSEGLCTVDLQGADLSLLEQRMQACAGELAAAGLTARLGAGETPLLAFYGAQNADPVLVVSESQKFLDPLPLEVATPSRLHADILHGWGIKTLGALTTLPKAEIARRLGTEGVSLWERAAGETTRVLRLVEPSKTFAAEWTYEPPVESMEPLLFRLRRFAECVALELRSSGFVADKLSLVLLLEDETDYRREFRLPEPGANVDGWMRVLYSHLESVRAEARVTGVRLIASPARPPQKQDGLFDTGLRDPGVFWENLARVGAIVGDDRVGTPFVFDTWIPDSIVLEKPTETIPQPEDDPVHPPRGLTLRRFRPPWPARITLVDQCPAAIESAEFRGEIRAANGPFYLSGKWWRPKDTWRLEIWQVEVETGSIYQIARTRSGWSVEGVLD